MEQISKSGLALSAFSYENSQKFYENSQEFYKKQISEKVLKRSLSLNAKNFTDFIESKISSQSPLDYAVLWCVNWLLESSNQSFSCLNLNELWSFKENKFPDFMSFFSPLENENQQNESVHNIEKINFQLLIEKLKNAEFIEFIDLNDKLALQKASKNLPLILTRLQNSNKEESKNQTSIYKLYLARIYADEFVVKKHILENLEKLENKNKNKEIKNDSKKQNFTKNLLNFLFKKDKTNSTDWQKLATAEMLNASFGIITGGPGTGKTTTVLKFLAALQIQNLLENSKKLNIVLCAPTGKAAARLNESISEKITKLESINSLVDYLSQNLSNQDYEDLQNLKNLLKKDENSFLNWADILPTQVQTLHKVLKSNPKSGYAFNEKRKLNLDVLVIDEASMLDLNIYSTMLLALPPSARLYLLGDQNQLASVEAGSVLADLCNLESNLYTKSQAQYLENLTDEQIPPEDIDENLQNKILKIAELKHSFRFDDDSSIDELAKFVKNSTINSNAKAEEETQILSVFEKNPQNLKAILCKFDKDSKNNSETKFKEQISNLAKTGWKNYLNHILELPETQDETAWDVWATQAFKKFNEFQFLVATRKGFRGFQTVNEILEKEFSSLFTEKQFTQKKETSKNSATAKNNFLTYGMPQLVTVNDAILSISNGDLCLLLPYKDKDVLQIHFLIDGKIKRIAKSRVENLEAGWAITVHKSQGSEFDNVVFIMPEQESHLLTKEILYTAITRTKEEFTLIYSDAEILNSTVKKNIKRWSGF